MKTILILLALTIPAFALTPPERELVHGMQTRLTELRKDLTDSQAANQSAIGSLAASAAQSEILVQNLLAKESEIKALAAERDGLRKEIAMLTEQVNAANARADREALAKEAVLTKYHRLKFYASAICAGLAIAIAGLLILRFAGQSLNTVPGALIIFGVPIAIGAVVFGAIQAAF